MTKKTFFAPIYSTCLFIIFYFKLTGFHFIEATGGMGFLSESTGGMFGIATIAGLDALSRVHSYYLSILFFATSVLLLNWLLSKALRKYNKLKIEFKLLEEVSMLGVLTVLFYALGNPIKETFLFTAVLFLVIIGIISTKILFFKTQKRNYNHYIFLFVLSFCITFFFLELSFILNINIPFQVLFWAVFISLFLFFELVRQDAIKYIKTLKPLAFIPLLSFLSDELYLVLNGKNIFTFTPSLIYFGGIFILVITVFFLFFKTNTHRFNVGKLIGNFYFPWILVGLCCVATLSWQLEWSVWHTEYFEFANPVLSIQRFYEFGEIPFFQTFNSHMLSEIIDFFSYTIINGYDGSLAMQNYSFLSSIFIVLGIYSFILKLTGNGVLSVGAVLFIPVTPNIILWPYGMVYFLLLILLNALKNKTKQSYYGFWLFLIFTAIYSIDLGVACVFSTSVLFLYFILIKKIKISEFKIVFIPLVYAFSTLIIAVFSVAFVFNLNVLYPLKTALKYLSSFQSYAYVGLGMKYGNLFMLHYLIFPTIAIFIFIYSYKYRTRFINTKLEDSYIMFLFLLIYYFVNMQRGLVRHSMMEHTDQFISSFLYFIFPTTIIYFLKIKKKTNRYFLFILISTAILFAFKTPKYPNKGLVLFESSLNKFFITKQNKPQTKRIDRSNNTNQKAIERKYKSINQFSKTYTLKNESFLDFANMPMVYFYLHKKVPSYFNQTLLSSHNFYLQNDYITTVKQNNICFAILANKKYGFEVDWFPNEVRHPLIAEYIYKNYQPMGILDSISVWVKKDFKYPEISPKIIHQSTTLQLENSIDLDITKKAYIEVFVQENSTDTILKINEIELAPIYSDLEFGKLFYDISTFDKIDSIHLQNDSINNINIYQSTYELDYYYLSPKNYSIANQLGMIPYQNANFEIDYSKFKTVFSYDSKINLKPNENFKFQIPKNINNADTSQFLYFETDYDLGAIDPWNPIDYTIDVEYGENKITNERIEIGITSRNQNKYLVRLTSQYNWVLKENSWLKFKNNNLPLQISNVKILNAQ